MAQMRGVVLTVFVGWLTTNALAFQLPGQRRQSKFANSFLPRNHRCQRWSLQGTKFEGTDPLVILGNRKYLSQTLSFSEDQLDKILEKEGGGNILTLEIGVLEERVHWLTSRLDLKKNEIKKIAQKKPDILAFQPDENLAPKLEYLQTRLLLDDKSLRKLILTVRNVLEMSTEDNIVPKLDWLQQRLDLDDAALSKMIQKCPTLFCYSVDTNIEPTLDWLQNRLDLVDPAVGKILQRHPTIICMRIDAMEPKLNWLQQRLNLNDAQLSRMIQRLPSLLGCSVDANIEPTLNWLQQQLDLDDASVSKMIQKMPPLLACNIDTNLKPTLDFYINALGDEEEALRIVIRDPSLFTYSLKNRLNPRLEEAQDAGMTIDSGCLKCIAKYTKDQWNTKVGNYLIRTNQV